MRIAAICFLLMNIMPPPAVHVWILNPQQDLSVPSGMPDSRLPWPSSYREWVWLSSGLGMIYEGGPGAPQFDNVFVDPASWRAFVQSGRWPEKTVIVLEEREAVSHGSINKAGHFQGTMTGLAAHVKDKRFPGGWAFYDFGPSKDPARVIPAAAACYSCHQKSGAVDTTFVQFYPTALEIAKRKGTLRQ